MPDGVIPGGPAFATTTTTTPVSVPGGPSFDGHPQPPDVPCDPVGDDWRGPPGPMGPAGPSGPPGTINGATNVRDYGAVGDGVADDTAALAAALAGVGASALFWPEGTYRITSTLVLPTGQKWTGVSDYRGGGTLIVWAGANNVPIVTTALGATEAGIERMAFDTGTATGVVSLHLKNCSTSHFLDLYFDCHGGAGNTCITIEAGADATVGNSAHNVFTHMTGRNSALGIVLRGTSASIATCNSFFAVDISSAFGYDGWVGIDFRQWCDSNVWHYCRLTAQGPNAVHVWCNSEDPTGVGSVYNEQFYGLFFDNIGTVTNVTGFKLASCYGIFARGVFYSPSPFTGTAIDADLVYAHSYDIGAANPHTLGGYGFMDLQQKGVVGADLTVPNLRGLRAGIWYRTPSGTALAGAAISAIGTLYATPFEVGRDSVVARLAFEVTAASGAPWHARLGVYHDSGFFSPGKLDAVLASPELTIAAGFTGTVETTDFVGARLARGRYWLVGTFDTTGASVRCVGGATAGAHPLGSMIYGSTSLSLLYSQQCGAYQTKAGAYAALPATFGTGVFTTGSATPAIAIKGG